MKAMPFGIRSFARPCMTVFSDIAGISFVLLWAVPGPGAYARSIAYRAGI